MSLLRRALVALKRVPDYNSIVRVDRNGVCLNLIWVGVFTKRDDGLIVYMQGSLDLSQVTWALNPFCDIALEEALRLKESKVFSSVTIVTVGDADAVQVLRTGLSKGSIDEAVHVLVEEPLRQLQVAKILSRVAQMKACDVVFLGKQSVDDDCSQTGQMLAGLMQCAQATQAKQVDYCNDRNTLIVTREIDAGLQTIDVSIPAVITADLRLNTPRYSTLANLMKAKKKSIEEIQASELGISLHSDIETISYEQRDTNRPLKMLGSADELINLL